MVHRAGGWSIAGRQPAIGEITPDGVTTLHTILETTLEPSDGVPADLQAITTGPDGALWFTDGGDIGRITTDGTIQQFPLTILGATADLITTSADGRSGSLLGNQPVR